MHKENMFMPRSLGQQDCIWLKEIPHFPAKQRQIPLEQTPLSDWKDFSSTRVSLWDRHFQAWIVWLTTSQPLWTSPCWSEKDIFLQQIFPNLSVFLVCFASTTKRNVVMISFFCWKLFSQDFAFSGKCSFAQLYWFFFLEGPITRSKKGNDLQFLKGCSLGQSHKNNFRMHLTTNSLN